MIQFKCISFKRAWLFLISINSGFKYKKDSKLDPGQWMINGHSNTYNKYTKIRSNTFWWLMWSLHFFWWSVAFIALENVYWFRNSQNKVGRDSNKCRKPVTHTWYTHNKYLILIIIIFTISKDSIINKYFTEEMIIFCTMKLVFFQKGVIIWKYYPEAGSATDQSCVFFPQMKIV